MPPGELRDDTEAAIHEIRGELSCDEAFDLPFEDDPRVFQYYFGGDVYVAECLEDLKQIDTLDTICPKGLVYDSLEGSRWANLLESAGAVFDIAECVGDFYRFWLATNNSGGNTYYVPKSFACDSLSASVRLTNGGLLLEVPWRTLKKEGKC
jgi:hypothetical protein